MIIRIDCYGFNKIIDEYCVRNMILIETDTIDKKEVSKKIISGLIGYYYINKRVKRKQILSLVKNIELDVYPRKDEVEKLTKDEMKQLREFCSGWKEFYLRNHGNIFNRL